MAGSLTNYLVNKIADHIFRGISYTMPTQLKVALIRPNKGYWAANTAYGTSDYIVPSTSNGRLYRCKTAGTSAAVAEPTWTTTDGGNTSDGTGGLVWTEQSLVLKAGIVSEMSGSNYARVNLNPSYSNWKGTNGEVTNTPSAGITGLIKNNATITFTPSTAAWGLITHVYMLDQSSNPMSFGSIYPQDIPLGAGMIINVGALTQYFS